VKKLKINAIIEVVRALIVVIIVVIIGAKLAITIISQPVPQDIGLALFGMGYTAISSSRSQLGTSKTSAPARPRRKR
jgi:hypothetical protein